ncbi:MAG: ATP-binding cassette domain-containing protein [Lentisphaeria bacterium]|nr:ATP-binding cassette domain-containing protein [Lentisphaeria bacterium]
MIQAVGLHKAFEGVPVLRGVSFEVPRGHFMALVGRSGHGKSVLLRHLAGMLRPDRGRVCIDGQDLASLGAHELRRLRRRFGFVFQGGALFDSMTVYDNVAFPLRECMRLEEEDVSRRASEALARVGLAGAEGKLPAQISGGMVKRAALARALVLEPELIFFDEPTTGLDPITAHAILELIAQCHRNLRFTGIIVSHQIPRIFEIVEHVGLLHDGRLRFVGTPDDMLASDDEVVVAMLRGDDAQMEPRRTPGPRR